MIWYGSRARGVEDEVADVDLWMLVDHEQVKNVERVAGTRFFVIQIGDVAGHITLRTIDQLESAFGPVAMETLYELRGSRVIRDRMGVAGALRDRARNTMPEAVRRAWFAHHYVEMRGEHRSADNPMFRGDAAAVLFGVTRTLDQALRAAMVLDGEPYPYHKWLHTSAGQTPTGRVIAGLVDESISLIEKGELRRVGDERDNPLSMKLREIRQTLIEAAKAGGLDGPWLEKWWYHIDSSRRSVQDVTWLI